MAAPSILPTECQRFKERLTSRSQRIGPKVRKNRRLESKWGAQYHNAIQNIVFGKQCLPYTPAEPPASLSEEIMESDPLYVCRHCRDCFRFQSSFKDHNARRSWILGLWCNSCFETVCTHINGTDSEDTKCLLCDKKDNDKRAYLRARGFTRSLKLGVIRVFYNQCQFVEHMKMHRLGAVNLCELMLMPLPLNMSNSDWSPEIEILCEALMERAFLLRIHIIDWLKMHNMQDNWWKLVDGKSNDSLLNRIVDGYQGRELFKIQERPIVLTGFDTPDVIHQVSKRSLDIDLIDNNFMDKNTNSYSANIISEKNIVENEDNPCTPTDITFVDCGPTSQCFEPEVPVNYGHKTVVKKSAQEIKNCRLANVVRTNNKTQNEASKDCNSLETDVIYENTITVNAGDNGSHKNLVIKQSFKDSVQQYKTAQPFVEKTAENNLNKSITKTGVSNILDSSVGIDIPLSAKKNAVNKTNSDNSKQSLQTSVANSNSKVLTIQDPKNITSIINQLPPHLISNKKVVLIEQDSGNVIACSKNEITTKKDSSNSVVDNGGADSNTISTQKICDTINIKKQEFAGKIVVKNGKKYLIKRTKNITNDPESSSNFPIVRNATKATKQLTSEHSTSRSMYISSNKAENIDSEQTVSLHNNISLLIPLPSPSELCSSSICELHVNKTLPKLHKLPPHLISISSKPTQKQSETISLIKEENGDLYMDIKAVDRITRESFRDVCDVIIKYRREMFDEFYQMSSLELKERLDHLRYVTEEMTQVLNFVSFHVFKEKLRSIHTIHCILDECFQKYSQDVQDEESDDVILNGWEACVDPVFKCPSCNRLMKPKSYIIGFSKLSKDENKYCSCYKQVCHECLSFQGTTSRFIAHQNFHKKSKPYVCPDCDSKFDSALALEIHTWTVCFHSLKRLVFACKLCEIDGFRDMESITRHFATMHSITKIGCEDCSRVFSSYSEYIKHYTETHPSKVEQNPIRLVISKLSNAIIRCENYMSYLEKHPAIRRLVWFKCPFCDLITVDNKHVSTLLNNHLRDIYHLEGLSKVLRKESFTKIFGTEFVKPGEDEVPTENSIDTFCRYTNEIACMNVGPKIVNTRTISSEIFERGSQDTEYMWSINSDGINNVTSQITEKIDGKEKIGPLPKISVRSIDDLKSKPKEAITKFSTKTKKKVNSPSLQAVVETEDGKVDEEEIAMELDDSNSKEETAKTKEPDESNNELTINASRVSENSLLIDTVDIRVNSPVKSNKRVLDSAFEASTDGQIKVVDFTKICKPNIEPLIIDEMCDIHIKNENASYVASMPKPPPLAKIPQHLLEPIETNKPGRSKKSKSKSRKVVNKTKERIALQADAQKEESVYYLCHLCGERINTSQSVAHFREKHSNEYKLAVVTPRLSRMSPDFINGGYKKFINSKKRKSDSSLYVPKRKRRWTRKKHIEAKDANPPVGLCVERETAEDDDGNFICKKCDQRCADMSDLRKHIAANHRLKDRYLICLECGENFVVAPSLQMHLKAFHGIEDPINYMNQNPSYAPGIDGDLQTGGKTTVANQCYVCMAVFEDKAAVDKHLRVHGMAFLNRKRIEARNALEKKANTEEEDKPSIIKDNPKEATKQDKPAETILDKINAAI